MIDSNSFDEKAVTRRGALKRGSLATVGLACGLSTVSGSASAQSLGCDVIVDSAGGQDAETVQAGVNLADPGDTVCVEDGTYEERIVIDKELTLRAANEHGATLWFEHDATNPGFPTVDVLADGVTVDGFDIVREVDPAVYDGGKRYAQAVKVGGFDATGGSNVTIANNVVRFAGDHDDPDDLSDNGIWVMDPEHGGDAVGVSVINNDVTGFADTGVGALGVYGDSVRNVDIRGNSVEEIDRGDPNPTFIYLTNATGHIRDNTVDNDGGDQGLQALGIKVEGGSEANVRDNEVVGYHRVGIIIDEDGTDATVTDNEVVGVGPKETGWAENGIQISSGASAVVRGNTVSDHWWAPDDWVSSGIIIFGSDDVTVGHNTVTDNDLGIGVTGANANVIHNEIEVTEASPGGYDTLHYGVTISGENNGVRQNSIDAVEGEIGIAVHPGSNRTKLIRNDIIGWEDAILDLGDDTKLPRPFVPE